MKRLLRRLRGRAAMRVGQIARLKPLDEEFGYGRGTPIDRHYVESFLARHCGDIGGRVLEVGDASYSRRFGGNRVARQDVLHVMPGNPAATIVGDLAQTGTLPREQFDCIILTQTLHLVFDMAAAVDGIHQALRPGGVALITVPGITPVDRGEWLESWYWSLTARALHRLLCGPFDPASVEVQSYGNLFAATAFLHGAAVEEVGIARLETRDAAYPVTVAARATKGAAPCAAPA